MGADRPARAWLRQHVPADRGVVLARVRAAGTRAGAALGAFSDPAACVGTVAAGLSVRRHHLAGRAVRGIMAAGGNIVFYHSRPENSALPGGANNRTRPARARRTASA